MSEASTRQRPIVSRRPSTRGMPCARSLDCRVTSRARCHVLAEAVVQEAQPLRQGVELARDHRVGDRRALHLRELLAECVEVVGELVDARIRRRRRRQRRAPRSALRAPRAAGGLPGRGRARLSRSTSASRMRTSSRSSARRSTRRSGAWSSRSEASSRASSSTRGSASGAGAGVQILAGTGERPGEILRRDDVGRRACSRSRRDVRQRLLGLALGRQLLDAVGDLLDPVGGRDRLCERGDLVAHGGKALAELVEPLRRSRPPGRRGPGGRRRASRRAPRPAPGAPRGGWRRRRRATSSRRSAPRVGRPRWRGFRARRRRPRGGRRGPRSGRRPAWPPAAPRTGSRSGRAARRARDRRRAATRAPTTVARSSASDCACSSSAAVDPASSASTASRCSNATSESCSATTSSGVTMFSTRAARAPSRLSISPGRRPGDPASSAMRSSIAASDARSSPASSFSPGSRRARPARPAGSRSPPDRRPDARRVPRRRRRAPRAGPPARGRGRRCGGAGRQLGDGGVDPGEIEGEPGHPGLQRAECLLDAAGDALEALRQRRERRLDPLRAGNGRLDPLGEVGDPVVELLGRLRRARPDALRELGDSILQPSRVLIVVVVRLGRAPRRGGWMRDRQELDRRALVGPLLGERARELEAGDGAELDENLAERLPRLLVLDSRLREVLLRGEPELEEDVADPASLRRRHRAHAEAPRSRHRWTRSGPAVAKRRQGSPHASYRDTRGTPRSLVPGRAQPQRGHE